LNSIFKKKNIVQRKRNRCSIKEKDGKKDLQALTADNTVLTKIMKKLLINTKINRNLILSKILDFSR